MSFPAPFLIRPTQKIINPIEGGTTTAYTVTVAGAKATTGIVNVAQTPPSGLPPANKWLVVGVAIYYGSTAFPAAWTVKLGGVAAVAAAAVFAKQTEGSGAKYAAGFFLFDAATIPANATLEIAGSMPAAQPDRGATTMGSLNVPVPVDEDPAHGRLGFNCCATYENATSLSNTPFGWTATANIGTQYNLRCGYAKLTSAAQNIVWKVANNSYTCPTAPATIVIR